MGEMLVDRRHVGQYEECLSKIGMLVHRRECSNRGMLVYESQVSQWENVSQLG
jgi:hypothetical protein